jgi:hypothetical protein
MSTTAFDQIVRDEIHDQDLKEIHRQELEDERQQIEYRYAMVNRPVGIGTIPKDGFLRHEPRPGKGEDHYDQARHGIIVFDRELTNQETYQYELALIPRRREMQQIAEEVAAELADYAEGYKNMALKSPGEFDRQVFLVSRDIAKGHPPSLGNLHDFSLMVFNELSRHD